MADDDKKNLDNVPAEQRLEEILTARWDPGKLSKFMRGSQQSRGDKLDFAQRHRFEKRLGVDLGDVRIYTGELAEEITKAHNAEALTVGSTGMILMRQSGYYTPGTASGTALLGHELTHVAQGRESAISRKKVSTDLAHEDASEAEAEKHEQQVLHEEQGGGGGGGGGGDGGGGGGDQSDEFKEKLVNAILRLQGIDKIIDELRNKHHT